MFKSLTMPCTRSKRPKTYKPGKQCDFELLAMRSESGTIDVYAHSEHSHPIMPEARGLEKQQKMGDKVIKIEPEDDAEDQQQEPPRKISKYKGCQMWEYNFLKSVKSVEELDDFRFIVIFKKEIIILL
jgi:hypothetical protein